ncbi:gag-protease polyprotein, partial [Trifolium medium]|nr:gag-protease polyprotein [Trifolium medium]
TLAHQVGGNLHTRRKQKKTISNLLEEKEKLASTITDLKEEITLLNSKLANMIKYVKMLNRGSDMLDEILEVGKRSGDMKGIWFDNNIIKEIKSVPKKTVPPKKKSQEQMFDQMSQHPAQLKYQKSDNMSQHLVRHRYSQHRGYKNSAKRCHHCGKYGHIKSECFKLYGYPTQKVNSPRNNKKKNLTKKMVKTKATYKDTQTKKVWKPKATTCMSAQTSFRGSKAKWYFDSRCSKHMIGVKKHLTEVKSHSNGYVISSDGRKGRIKGICKLAIPGLPCLDDVLLVEGLITNLISISQLCDQGLDVHCNNSECIISNKDQEVLMKGSKTRNKCYLWIPHNKSQQGLSVKEDNTKMSHKMVQHLCSSKEFESGQTNKAKGTLETRKPYTFKISLIKGSRSHRVCESSIDQHDVIQDVRTLSAQEDPNIPMEENHEELGTQDLNSKYQVRRRKERQKRKSWNLCTTRIHGFFDGFNINLLAILAASKFVTAKSVTK